jgi:pyruvate formate lyase activating enzyme
MVPSGYVAGLQVDPTEKKPFFHVLPGSRALTFGMLGCNFHCSFCQNWVSSQALRDPVAGTIPETIAAREMISLGVRHEAHLVASSYNEPLITTEWAVEVFKEAKAKGLRTFYVSNGYATKEVLDYLHPWLDGLNIDLKCFTDPGYRRLGGVLQHVLDTIERAHGMGLWIEVVTLVVPGFNDSADELREMARFLVSISPDIPWHVTAFHPDYKERDGRYTSASTLFRAASIGHEEGLRFIYAGNLPGATQSLENTYCPRCGQTLVERRGYHVGSYRITPQGACSDCGTSIAGIWWDDPHR